jgi:pyridoxal phosphate-dependent aminotransferase EpsN
MSNLLAAVGRPQLEEIEARVEKRRTIFKRYREALGSIPGVDFMPEAPFGRANRWLTVMTLDPEITGLKPMDVINKLSSANIEARPVWKPMHLQPVFQGYPFFGAENGQDNSSRFFETGLCLPSGSSLSAEDQKHTLRVILEGFSEHG